MQSLGLGAGSKPRFDAVLVASDAEFRAALQAQFLGAGMTLQSIADPLLVEALDFGRFSHAIVDTDTDGLHDDHLRFVAGQLDCTVLATRLTAADRIGLIEAGVRSFLAKPVDPRELALIVARANTTPRVAALRVDNPVWLLNRTRRSIRLPEGQEVNLTASEYYALEMLMDAAPDPVEKIALCESLPGGVTGSPESRLRSLEVLLSRLRNRLSLPAFPLPIKSERNHGYVFLGQSRVSD